MPANGCGRGRGVPLLAAIPSRSLEGPISRVLLNAAVLLARFHGAVVSTDAEVMIARRTLALLARQSAELTVENLSR
jgi:hypothetical protein